MGCMSKRIALVTCRHHDHIDHAAEGRLLQALAREGASATWVAWDVGIAWDFDAAVIRTTWDYWDRLDEFLAWVDGVECPLLNDPETVRANLRKTYLRRLEGAGVAVVPTVWAPKGADEAGVARVIGESRGLWESNGWSGAVVKPEVGAAASNLERYGSLDEPALAAHVLRLSRVGEVLVQPFLPNIVDHGEVSVVLLAGTDGPEVSHAVRKVPASGDFRVQCDFGGRYRVVEPTEAEVDVAMRAVRAWEDMYGHGPLYARVDLVEPEAGKPMLIELELVEPELFFGMVEGSAERFARAILNRVAQESDR